MEKKGKDNFVSTCMIHLKHPIFGIKGNFTIIEICARYDDQNELEITNR